MATKARTRRRARNRVKGRDLVGKTAAELDPKADYEIVERDDPQPGQAAQGHGSGLNAVEGRTLDAEADRAEMLYCEAEARRFEETRQHDLAQIERRMIREQIAGVMGESRRNYRRMRETDKRAYEVEGSLEASKGEVLQLRGLLDKASEEVDRLRNRRRRKTA